MLTAPLQRGKTPPNEATCWPWAATCKALGQNPDCWAVIDPATEWSVACNTSLWPLLGLMGGQIGPDLINWLILTCPSTYIGLFFPNHIVQSALVELFNLILRNYSQPFIPYVLEGGGWGSIVLRSRTYDRCEIVIFKSIIWQRLRIILFAWVYWYCIPVSAKANGLPPWFIPFSSWIPWWVVEHKTSELQLAIMAFSSSKKLKRTLMETESDYEGVASFPDS